MSGGSMDYFFYKLEDIADIEKDIELRELMHDLADYLKAEEWFDSGDITEDDYNKSLHDFKLKWLNKDQYKKTLEGLIKKRIDSIKEECLSLLNDK